jgi:hypothetical protein
MITIEGQTYLDVPGLFIRGWTENLVRKFLGEPDTLTGVNHWLNFSAKRCYSLSRVEMTEVREDFKEAFQRSVRKRKLNADAVNGFNMERKIARQQVKVWIGSLARNDVGYLNLSTSAESIYLS